MFNIDDFTKLFKCSASFSSFCVPAAGMDAYLNNKIALINGKKATFDEPARAINNRTMIPLRFVSENMGAAVEYGPQSQTITAE